MDRSNISTNKLPNEKVDNSFSRMERECMYYILRGMSAKQIGRELKRSARTIEDYTNKIKNKFNCHTKSELINNIWDSIFSFDEAFLFGTRNRK